MDEEQRERVNTNSLKGNQTFQRSGIVGNLQKTFGFIW